MNNKKIAKIILSKVLEMPLKKYLNYINKTTEGVVSFYKLKKQTWQPDDNTHLLHKTISPELCQKHPFGNNKKFYYAKIFIKDNNLNFKIYDKRLEIMVLIKYSLLAIAFLIFVSEGKAQRKKGYTLLTTIKHPRYRYKSSDIDLDTRAAHVRAIKITKNEKYLIISYGFNPTILTIHKFGGYWHRLKEYEVAGVIDLNNSYYYEEDSCMYVNYERYSTKYKRIDLKTDRFKIVPCNTTPNGCNYIDERDKTSMYSSNDKFFITKSKYYKSDVLIYKKE